MVLEQENIHVGFPNLLIELLVCFRFTVHTSVMFCKIIEMFYLIGFYVYATQMICVYYMQTLVRHMRLACWPLLKSFAKTLPTRFVFHFLQIFNILYLTLFQYHHELLFSIF
jgi:hypothetical protein